MKKTSKEPIESGNELKEAIELLEKEKNISKDSLLEAIQNSLLSACFETRARPPTPSRCGKRPDAAIAYSPGALN